MAVGIIDYGMGNLHSVKNALDFIGAESFVSDDVNKLEGADRLILPGVGAFPDAMKTLNESGLSGFIREQAQKKPLLGICLGMQLLFDKSWEFGECEGLGLIPGEVIKLTAAEHDRSYKIPHMGWNCLVCDNPSPILEGLGDEMYVYFVHSYKAVPSERKYLIAHTEYGEEIAAVVQRGNVYGCQFHPEKSEKLGLNIIKNFTLLPI